MANEDNHVAEKVGEGVGAAAGALLQERGLLLQLQELRPA